MNLSPLPVQRFYSNIGLPLVGGKLFTYTAGTTTKIATYQNSAGTLNTNPVIMNFRGEANIWLDPSLTYKFVLAGPLDTDPPTNPIWTVDNISVYGGLTADFIGQILWPRSPAEIAASVTPVHYRYIWGDVRRYGAVGDGVTDDTNAINTALSVQQDVFVADGLNCKTSGPLNMNSSQTLYGVGYQSQITCTGTFTNAVSISGKTRATVRDLFVKFSGTSSNGADGAAVFIGNGSTYCKVLRCRLEGVRAGVTVYLSDYSTVDDNLISSVTLAVPEVTWDIGVYLGGSYNEITRNRCFGGSAVGVQILSDFTTSVDRNIVGYNHINTHSSYGIVIYANLPGGTAEKNTVVGNQIWDITGLIDSPGSRSKGAGIYIASAEWTTVCANVLQNTNVNTDLQVLAPGAIGVGGVSNVSIVGNIIKSPRWYGIYIATDGNNTGGIIVDANTVSDPIKTAIRTVDVSNVTISNNRATNGSDNGIHVTHSGTAIGVTVQGNGMKSFTAAGATAFRIENAQCPRVLGNWAHSSTIGFSFFTDTGAIVQANEARNNTTTDFNFDASSGGVILFNGNTARSTATNGVNDQVGVVYGVNDIAGQTNVYAGVGLERTLATSATPSALGSRMAVYAGATAITDLLNPMPGQVLTVRATNNIQLNHNAGAATTKLLLKGAVNAAMVANNTLTLEYPPPTGPWYEISRNF